MSYCTRANIALVDLMMGSIALARGRIPKRTKSRKDHDI